VTRKRQDTDLLTIWQQAGEQGDNGLRRLVQSVVQQVLEAEMTAFIGAEPYERNAGRRGHRNGYKPRTLKTRVGELELMVPKDRDG
jgi:putative transposase